MANDFLITFTVDGNLAIQMMQRIGQVATQTQAQINALNNSGRTGAGAGGGILNSLGIAPAQLQGSLRSMQSLADTVARMSASRQAATTLGLQTGAGTLKAEAIATQQLAEQYGVLGGRYANLKNVGSSYLATSQRLSGEAKNLAAQSKVVANQLDDTGQAFGRHARRVFEGILIYEAFGRAVQAVAAGIKLVIDIDQESRRLQAVLGTTTTATSAFIDELGKIASETVTPFEDLVAQADTASAAFADIEDPTKRAAAALELMRDAGKFTSITQHSLAEEITNLTAIMKLFSIPIEKMDDFLGKLVVAGGNSSVVIADLTDALRLTAQAANDAGISFDTGFGEILLASMNKFRIATGRTGTDVGNTFKQLFTQFGKDDVIKSVTSITNGMLKLRDATGQIRNPLVVMSELNALLKTGALNATEFSDVLAALTPPLAPQRRPDFTLIVRQLSELGPIIDKLAGAGKSNLDKLVDQINAALGPQFRKLIIDAQRSFKDLFGPGIIAIGFSIINVLRGIGDVLKQIPAPILSGVIGFLSLVAAWRLLVFAGKGLGSILGVGGIVTGLKDIGKQAAAAGVRSAAFGSGMTILGRGVVIAKTAMIGLITQLGILLPLLALFMAIDFAQQVSEADKALGQQVASLSEGRDLAALKALRAKLEEQRQAAVPSFIVPVPGRKQTFNPLDIIGGAIVGSSIQGKIDALDKVIAGLAAKGPGAVVNIDDINKALGITTEKATDTTSALDDVSALYKKMFGDATDLAGGFAGLSEQERIAAESGQLLASLADEQADAMLTLNERLKAGKISQEEWTTGQDLVNRSAKVASDLVASLGDSLRTLVPELANAGDGTDNLAGNLFKLVLQSGNSIGMIESITGTILNLAAATGVAASGIAGMTAQAVAFAAIQHAISANPFGAIANLPNLLKIGAAAGSAAAQLARAIAQLRNVFATSGSKPFGVGGGGAKASAPQTPLLDIGKLPPDQIAKLIAIATTLRNSIPGETKADKNDIVALLKDAKFLQTVKGIDERLLRIALEQLTATMDKNNELMKSSLSNLAVSAGPLSGLISAPTLLGINGSGISRGSGLNFDPKNGDLVIQFNGDFTGMSPEQISKYIYDAIAKAIRESGRL